jgi:hypothetical protein
MATLSNALYYVLAYFFMFGVQTELVVQAAGYEDVVADCTLLWCSWTARDAATGTLVSGRARCTPLLDCVTEPIRPAPATARPASSAPGAPPAPQ